MLPSSSSSLSALVVNLIQRSRRRDTRECWPHPHRHSAFTPRCWRSVLRRFRDCPSAFGRYASCRLELNFRLIWSAGIERVTEESENKAFRDNPDDSAFSRPAKKKRFKRSFEEAIRQPRGVAARVTTTTRTGPRASVRGRYRQPAGYKLDRGEMGSRTILVVALALAPAVLALAACPAQAPEIALPLSAYPSSLNKQFPDPTIGIRG